MTASLTTLKQIVKEWISLLFGYYTGEEASLVIILGKKQVWLLYWGRGKFGYYTGEEASLVIILGKRQVCLNLVVLLFSHFLFLRKAGTLPTSRF
jgi:hypothetical protein